MASFVSRLHKHGPGKVQVTILASEWGSSKGGLSTINRELAIQLAKFSCLEVIFFLPKCADEDKKAAESHGVSIVVAKRRPGYKELSWLSFAPEHLKIDVVVGHGVKLGRQAQVIRESHKCKWVQVVHTDPEELGMCKGYENSISKGEQKHRVEKELCCMADFVVGVGPKLAEAFRKYLGSCEKHQDVFEFTPGIFDEFSSVQQILDERKQCSVLVFGRGDEEDFKLKGFDIAAKAVAALSDTILVFVGSPHGKQEEIAKQFIDFGIPANRLRVRSYMEREALKELFYEVDLVLMPSRTEGFGLTGLEALSAGLPVLVSKNSGFGEALDSIQVGSIFVMDSEDHSTWTGAIKDIWDKDRKSRLDEVKTVRDFYAERYSWSEQCKHLVEKMIRLLDETSSNPEITAQAMKAREQNGNKDFAGVQGYGSKFAAHKSIVFLAYSIAKGRKIIRQDGAQGGHEKKRSLSDHQETFIRSSSGSTSDEFLPREGPDQPEEVSAGGAQGMRPRSNVVSRECRKPPTHAAREENPDQPSASDVKEGKIDKKAIDEDGKRYGGNAEREDREEPDKVAIFEGRVTNKGSHLDLSVGAIHLTFPPDSVAEPAGIMIYRWKYDVCLPQLKEHEAVVSDVIEISAATEVGGLTFNNEVKLVLSHSAADLEGYELVLIRLVDTEKNEWEEIAGCIDIRQVADIDDYPCPNNVPYSFPVVLAGIIKCSTYAVVSRLKLSPTFTITVSGGTFVHPNYPQVTITVPQKAVTTETSLSLELGVQEVPQDEFQGHGLFCGPILRLLCSSRATFLKPVTIQLPVSLGNKLVNIPQAAECRVRIFFLSSERESKEWVEISDKLENPASYDGKLVKFKVQHFSRFAFVVGFAAVAVAVPYLLRKIWIQPQVADFVAYFDPKKRLGSLDILFLICCPAHQSKEEKHELEKAGLTPCVVTSKRDMIPGRDKAFVFVSGGINFARSEDMGDFFLRFHGNKAHRDQLQVRLISDKVYCNVQFRRTPDTTENNNLLSTLDLTFSSSIDRQVDDLFLFVADQGTKRRHFRGSRLR
ncbi:uncharacterized protein LOC141879199 isoform X5 [Acropora palmata]|uniref:uncharacterized protein LOC141879199 isoform X5 n=1 Tax=Acropora palmata TaxID=6131 RepID=UPI003DA1C426